MKAYIRGAGIISPQKTFLSKEFLEDLVVSETNFLKCIEPSYKDYLDPIMARRMGRIVKMGIAAATEALKDANIEMPDAIITGTALGCLGDTEKFLSAIIADDEQFLTPTSFIQSIQNTVSAQIALQLKCMNHNFTFVHKGFSFESALLDSLMMIEENDAENILVGGLDEMTEKNLFIYNRQGNWKKKKIKSSELYAHRSHGTIGGEGAAFFVLSKNASSNDYANLLGVKTIYNPTSLEEINTQIDSLLKENSLSKDDVSLVLYGINGDTATDNFYDQFKTQFFPHTPSGAFKHLCGEYQTSGSFAMWMAAMILKNQWIPSAVMHPSQPVTLPIKSVLIYNNYENNHSVMLVGRV